jgi:hypothetical protein
VGWEESPPFGWGEGLWEWGKGANRSKCPKVATVRSNGSEGRVGTAQGPTRDVVRCRSERRRRIKRPALSRDRSRFGDDLGKDLSDGRPQRAIGPEVLAREASRSGEGVGLRGCQDFRPSLGRTQHVCTEMNAPMQRLMGGSLVFSAMPRRSIEIDKIEPVRAGRDIDLDRNAELKGRGHRGTHQGGKARNLGVWGLEDEFVMDLKQHPRL